MVAFILGKRYYAIWRLHMNSDRIEKKIVLKAPVSRVWRALTDHREFGEWFRVKLEGPFAVGEVVRGKITYPGYEHLLFEARVKTMEPERLFAFTWPASSPDSSGDSSKDPWTLVEFLLEETEGGTLLRLRESGFDRLPVSRRLEAYRSNEGGWEEQMKNIARHVE
jgi:uncharacterized protein YndB with AHSA1/START domain